MGSRSHHWSPRTAASSYSARAAVSNASPQATVGRSAGNELSDGSVGDAGDSVGEHRLLQALWCIWDWTRTLGLKDGTHHEFFDMVGYDMDSRSTKRSSRAISPGGGHDHLQLHRC